MFGGVLSALIVGFILDRKNLYAEVIADSYAQASDDPEFWKGLSEEQRKKAEEMFQRAREVNGDFTKLKVENLKESSNNSEETTSKPAAATAASTTKKSDNVSTTKKSDDIDMFSDYGD